MISSQDATRVNGGDAHPTTSGEDYPLKSSRIITFARVRQSGGVCALPTINVDREGLSPTPTFPVARFQSQPPRGVRLYD
jgi:hypothetical protein